MTLSAFDDKASPPTDQALEAVLGRSGKLWTRLKLDLQEAHNPTPGKGKAVPLAKTKKPRSKAKSKDKNEQLVVVGTKQDGCGNRLSSSERRRAVIRQQVRGGMTQRDVESALGKPDKITTNDGQTRYHYADDKGNKRQVNFDEYGCEKAKGKR